LALAIPQVHGQGDETLLGAVVEVALDAAAFGLSRVDGPVAAGLEGLDPGPELAVAGAEQRQGDRAVGGRHALDRPGGGHAQDRADHAGQEGLGQGVDDQVPAGVVDDQGRAAVARDPVPQRRRQQPDGGGPQGDGDHEPDHPDREQHHQVGQVLPGRRVAGQDPGPPPQRPVWQRPVGVGDLDPEHGPDPAPLQPGPAPPGEQGQGEHEHPDPDDQGPDAEGEADGQHDVPGQADEHGEQQVDRGREGPWPQQRLQHPAQRPAARPARRRLPDRHCPLLGVAFDLASQG
jgi:hypothetical protein